MKSRTNVLVRLRLVNRPLTAPAQVILVVVCCISLIGITITDKLLSDTGLPLEHHFWPGIYLFLIFKLFQTLHWFSPYLRGVLAAVGWLFYLVEALDLWVAMLFTLGGISQHDLAAASFTGYSLPLIGLLGLVALCLALLPELVHWFGNQPNEP